ncbi:type II toxin-antitoxin system PemK/MazF family toxin [Piscinibacter sp.]|uniref:type II toxin-antitoxin system PemK/MazF family toxin n=1 Tax=Piscinibacter sp. TaxID=1903157 RepID=UPI0039E62447
MKSPPRGEVWLVDLGLAAKVRPCLVLNVPIEEPERSLVCLVPHTTSVRGSRFEVPTRVRFLQPGAFDAQSIVTVPTVRLVRRLGVLAAIQLADVEAAVLAWLGISRDA